VDGSARTLADTNKTDDFKGCIFPQPAEPKNDTGFSSHRRLK